MLHGPSHLERCQNRVGVDGRATENIIPERIRQGIQHGRASAADGRLADAACTDGRFGIRKIQSLPLHVHGDIQDRWRLGVVEPPGHHRTVVGVEDPLLSDRMANAESGAAEDLPAQCCRVNHGAHIRDRKEIHEVILAGLDIDFDLGETGNERIRRAVAGILILRGG